MIEKTTAITGGEVSVAWIVFVGFAAVGLSMLLRPDWWRALPLHRKTPLLLTRIWGLFGLSVSAFIFYKAELWVDLAGWLDNLRH